MLWVPVLIRGQSDLPLSAYHRLHSWEIAPPPPPKSCLAASIPSWVGPGRGHYWNLQKSSTKINFLVNLLFLHRLVKVLFSLHLLGSVPEALKGLPSCHQWQEPILAEWLFVIIVGNHFLMTRMSLCGSWETDSWILTYDPSHHPNERADEGIPTNAICRPSSAL